ncbi:MAG: hypothetical protein LKG23_06615 [Nitrospira sp.]|nr:hypothetical protein [Nitrospira sp.]
MPFYIRPLAGALTKVFTFFVGHLLGASLPFDGQNWASQEGRVPYINLTFLTGFAPQEFMQQLKQAAQTIAPSDVRGKKAQRA